MTGRLKDLLIIDGRNHYPQDIELTVEKCHSAFRTGCSAAFSLDLDGERLVVVQEIKSQGRGFDTAAILESVRQAISQRHELAVHAISLVKTGSVPKTTSGKIQRSLCREMYVNGEFHVIDKYCSSNELASPGGEGAIPEESVPANTGRDRAVGGARPDRFSCEKSHREIQRWLSARVGDKLKCEACDVNVHQPFASYGLTSRDAIELSGDMESWLGRRLSPALVYEHSTIDSLASFLSSDVKPVVSPVPVSGVTLVDPIAIVGIGCRLPGAADPDEFWKLLMDGRNAITQVPSDRWDADAVDEQVGFVGASDVRGTVRWGGWLSEVDQFDPRFFGISPREAACIDPQQRLLMEVAWEALEDAGQVAPNIRGSSTGVFVGISTNDYRQHFMDRVGELDPYWSTGNASCIAANRLSYFFDFKGPSLAVDTACSSSLVAVRWACQSCAAANAIWPWPVVSMRFCPRKFP